MNNKLLQKCVDELKGEKPNLQYVLGIMETLIELSTPSTIPPYIPRFDNPVIHPDHLNNLKTDEERIPDAARVGPIGRINS